MSSNTKTPTRPGTRAPRGSRPGGGPGRRPGGGDGRHAASPTTRGTLRTSPIRPEEVLGMGMAGSAESLSGYRALFRRALVVALEDGAPLALARSRAAATTWDLAGPVSHEEAERARVEEFAAFLAERGEAHPTRAALVPLYADDPLPVEDDHGEPEAPEREGERAARRPRVPRPRPLPGDRVRRGGKR